MPAWGGARVGRVTSGTNPNNQTVHPLAPQQRIPCPRIPALPAPLAAPGVANRSHGVGNIPPPRHPVAFLGGHPLRVIDLAVPLVQLQDDQLLDHRLERSSGGGVFSPESPWDRRFLQETRVGPRSGVGRPGLGACVLSELTERARLADVPLARQQDEPAVALGRRLCAAASQRCFILTRSRAASLPPAAIQAWITSAAFFGL